VRKKKILLACEDYAELSRLQKDLMRLGFDLVGTQSEHQLQKELLEFNPELIMILTRSQKLSFQSVMDKIRAASVFRGLVFLLVPQGFQIDPQMLTKTRIDGILPASIDFKVLIQKICDALKIDSSKVLDKLKKLESSGQGVGGDQGQVSLSGHQRQQSIIISGKINYRPRDYRMVSKKLEEELSREGIKFDPLTTSFADPRLEQIRRDIRAEGKEQGGPSGSFGPSGQVPYDWVLAPAVLADDSKEDFGSGSKWNSSHQVSQSTSQVTRDPSQLTDEQMRELKKNFVRGLVKSGKRKND
jgi:hypothetical protein